MSDVSLSVGKSCLLWLRALPHVNAHQISLFETCGTSLVGVLIRKKFIGNHCNLHECCKLLLIGLLVFIPSMLGCVVSLMLVSVLQSKFQFVRREIRLTTVFWLKLQCWLLQRVCLKESRWELLVPSVCSCTWGMRKEDICKVSRHGKTDPCPKKIRARFDPINGGKDVIGVERENEWAAGMQQ